MAVHQTNPAVPSFEGIVTLVGAYGSGKTEVAINLAAAFKGAGRDVWIVDLDLVNPYFRTREARGPLAQMEIGLVLPDAPYLKADLPVLSPQVAGVIRQSEGLVILDVGGDDAGATVLAALADAFHAAGGSGRPLHLLFVVNPFRPFTETLSGCQKMQASIESKSGLKMTGIIANPNLMEETRKAHIEKGYRFVARFSDQSGLPLEVLAVPGWLVEALEPCAFRCPILPIERQLVPPWKNPEKLSRCALMEGCNLQKPMPSSGQVQPLDPCEKRSDH